VVRLLGERRGVLVVSVWQLLALAWHNAILGRPTAQPRPANAGPGSPPSPTLRLAQSALNTLAPRT